MLSSGLGFVFLQSALLTRNITNMITRRNADFMASLSQTSGTELFTGGLSVLTVLTGHLMPLSYGHITPVDHGFNVNCW